MSEYMALARALDVRLQGAVADNARLRAEVERLQANAEERARSAGFTAAEAAHLRGVVARLRGVVARLRHDDERVCERAQDYVCGECHGCLTREGGEGSMPTVNCDVCGSTVEPENDWTDGPDSEAARAARGEGTNARSPEWSAPGLDRADDPRGCCVCGGPPPNWSAENGEVLCGYCVVGRKRPDPSYTPAVCRVVVWDGGRGTRRSIEDAYVDAAWQLIHRSVKRSPTPWDVWWAHWPDSRVHRLAAWLRHRDEKAGHPR